MGQNQTTVRWKKIMTMEASDSIWKASLIRFISLNMMMMMIIILTMMTSHGGRKRSRRMRRWQRMRRKMRRRKEMEETIGGSVTPD